GSLRLRAARVREPRPPLRRPVAPGAAGPIARPLTRARIETRRRPQTRRARHFTGRSKIAPCTEPEGLPPRFVGLHLGRKSNRLRRTGDPKTNTFRSRIYYVRLA